jgi:peptidoglycan L-alanyl-D-glutamate endopeptidase CwlK
MLYPFEEEILAKLYPPFASQVRAFILDARAKGFSVGVQCGLRLYADQQALFNIGRDASGNVVGKVVTRARPGFSLHQYGLAVDIVFDLDPSNPGHEWSWDEDLPWESLAELGRSHGLEPGFFWSGGTQDKPHFENRYDFQIADLLRTLIGANQNLSAVWAIIDHRQAVAKLST